MTDDVMKKKHANERLVNAWFEERRATDEVENAAARAGKARAAVKEAIAGAIEAYALQAGAKPVYVRYGSDKLLILSASDCRVEVLRNDL